MTQETTQTTLQDQGRFEVSVEGFESAIKGISANSILDFDLKEFFPQAFVQNTNVPRSLARLLRKNCDEILDQYRGVYTNTQGGAFRLYFYDIPAAMGKIKLEMIIDRMKESVEIAEGNATGPAEIIKVDESADVAKNAPKKVGQSNADVSRILKEGLGSNPNLETFHFWLNRVMQDMLHSGQKLPLTRDMADLASKSDIHFLPFWNYDSQIMSGSMVVVRGSIPASQYNDGEIPRQDLAGLFAACLQIRGLQLKGSNALAVVDFRVQTLQDKDCSEFLLVFFKMLPPEIKRSLIIEIKGMPSSAVPTSLITTIERMSSFVRAYSFDTGILANISYQRSFPKLHACGFDVSEVPMPTEELVRLINKYAENQKKHGVKYYIKGVSSAEVFDAAVKAGFNYVSGNYIRPAQKICWPAQQMTIAMIKNPGPLARSSSNVSAAASEKTSRSGEGQQLSKN